MTGQCEGSVRVGIWESWAGVAGGFAAWCAERLCLSGNTRAFLRRGCASPRDL